MKLTWFGGTAFRAYLGGEIIVVDPEAAPAGVDRRELVAGADRVVALAEAMPTIDPAGWRRRPAGRAMDDAPPGEILRIGEQALLMAAVGEPPLVLLMPGALPQFGRWADGAVIVVLSERPALVAEVTAMLEMAQPRLVALAMDTLTLDAAIQEIAGHLDGAGLVSMEAGLALEV